MCICIHAKIINLFAPFELIFFSVLYIMICVRNLIFLRRLIYGTD